MDFLVLLNGLYESDWMSVYASVDAELPDSGVDVSASSPPFVPSWCLIATLLDI